MKNKSILILETNYLPNKFKGNYKPKIVSYGMLKIQSVKDFIFSNVNSC